VTVLCSGAADRNVRLTAPAPLMVPIAVNSLDLRDGPLTATTAGDGTVSVTSGAVHLTNATVATPLQFSATEAVLAGTGSITGAIHGSAGVTIGGSIALSGASNYTGPTSLAGTRLTV